MDDLLNYIGKRIRLFRKTRKMSIDGLAKSINKSKATVSKYESGGIAIDIATLFDISRALEIDIRQLISYTPPEVIPPLPPNPFGQTEYLYLYQLCENKVFSSVIHLKPHRETGKIDATLYYKLADIKDFEKCDCVYHGIMKCHDNIMNFMFENYHNKSETAMINFFIPVKKVSAVSGLMSGIKANNLFPSAFKVILSKDFIKPDEEFKKHLKMSAESYKKLKADNMYTVEALT